MKRKKIDFKAVVPMLALMLALSAGTAYPGLGTVDDGTVPPSPEPPVEEEIPETEDNDGIQPLTDRDDVVTKAPE